MMMSVLESVYQERPVWAVQDVESKTDMCCTVLGLRTLGFLFGKLVDAGLPGNLAAAV